MNIELQDQTLRTYGDLSKVECDEIVQLYRDGAKLKEIVAAYRLKHHTIVCDLAKRAGVPRRSPRKHPRRSGSPQPSLEERKAALEAQLAEVQGQIAERDIRFAWAEPRTFNGNPGTKSFVETGDPSADVAIIHGFGRNFRRLGGFKKLLEWYLKEFPTAASYEVAS